MDSGKQKVFTCSYDGYVRWHDRVVTKAMVDSKEEVAESDEENNIKRKTILVKRHELPQMK
jgi:subtilase family serine protease